MKHSQDVHLCFVFLFSHGMELLLFKRFHNLTMKGENYQLDLSKLLIVFKANQNILISCHTEKQSKIKNKKKFVGVTEKYPKIEEYLNMYNGKLFERN